MAGITDPGARARSYVARETGLRERETLEARVTALERLVGSQYEAAGTEGRPPAWTMVEIVTALPQPTKDMVGRLAALRREDGFLLLNVCVLNGVGVAEWAIAMALAITLTATPMNSGGIAVSGGGTLTYVPSPLS